MRYEDLVRLARDREQWRNMTADLLKKTALDDDDDDSTVHVFLPFGIGCGDESAWYDIVQIWKISDWEPIQRI